MWSLGLADRSLSFIPALHWVCSFPLVKQGEPRGTPSSYRWLEMAQGFFFYVVLAGNLEEKLDIGFRASLSPKWERGGGQ